jgi:uncharacterized protein (TIGR00375 family)
MSFIADFHIHSRFSRATARNLDLEHIYVAAQKKGISVIGTGDFTYPQWFEEITAKLVPAEEGLYRLKPEIAAVCDRKVPAACRGEVRFILTAEISNIYKKNGSTRKNHNLIFLADTASVARMNARLDRIGNIRSDGRPILGLDARDLLELLLETSPDGFLIPAHIWTPWFSVLGSKSGFDCIEACFEDLSSHIFALETGLSSDPAMNWRVSGLDRFTLVSNSDAHSPAKIGREANLFDTEMSYFAIRSALNGADARGFKATFEFYPQEGKYHADGHRACSVCLLPRETHENGGVCPVCGKGLTLGVLHRVEQLADRPPGYTKKAAPPFYSLIPLDEVLSEIFGVGPASRRVARALEGLLQKIGPELYILHSAEEALIETAGIPLLAEAIGRMRRGDILLTPGYDGEFGKIKIFYTDEKKRLQGQKLLFKPSASDPRARSTKSGVIPQKDAIANEERPLPCRSGAQKALFPFSGKPAGRQTPPVGTPPVENIGQRLNPEQQAAVEHDGGPLMIIAGPGTGKTRTLTCRIAHLIRHVGVCPEKILALTFTNRAAEEMRSRLEGLLGPDTALPFVGTFHGFCLALLKSDPDGNCQVIDDQGRLALLGEVVSALISAGASPNTPEKRLLERIVAAKQAILGPEDDLSALGTPEEVTQFVEVYRLYEQWMGVEKTCDYEGLILRVVKRLETDPAFAERCRQRFTHLFVDEYQDLNHGQYRIIRALAGSREAPLFVIGDPDQSIYGFRGSDSAYFERFARDFPGARTIRLSRNYRSTDAILKASGQIIRKAVDRTRDIRVYGSAGGDAAIGIMELANERAEAVAIGKTIENLVGGLDFHALDAGQVHTGQAAAEKSFADIAILYRTHDQEKVLAQTLAQAGIPVQTAAPLRQRDSATAALLSLLRTILGLGTYADFDHIRILAVPTVGGRTATLFKRWGYRCGLSLKRALVQSTRLPIPGMSSGQQKRLYSLVSYLFALDRDTKQLPLPDRLTYLAANTKLERSFKSAGKPDTSDSLQKLVALAERAGGDPERFFSTVALQSETDAYDAKCQKVALMTMHAAKGLEFPVVFIAGCEKDLIPLTRGREAIDIDEERRLFYVAMTRAGERLYFTRARTRTLHGQRLDRDVSPFVADIEKGLIRRESAGSGKKMISRQVQLTLFN